MLEPDADDAVASLAVLAHEHRWRLVRALARSDRRVHELTDLVGAPQNLVSYHLRQLREAGLVTARRSSADGRDTYYRVHLDRVATLLCDTGSAVHPALRLGALPPAAPARRGARAVRVLFVCTGNSARSPMAEALLARRAGPAVRAYSAGSHPKPLHPNAVRVLAARGVDIAGRRPQSLRRFERVAVDHVVTLCDRVREVCPPFPSRPGHVHWSVADPSLDGDTDEASYPAFERTADELEGRIGDLLAYLGAPTPPPDPGGRP